MFDDYMTTKEVADFLGLTIQTINQKAFADKKFPDRYIIQGTKRKGFLRSEINQYKKNNYASENLISRKQLRQKLEDMGLGCSYSHIQVQSHYGQLPKGKKINNRVYYSVAEADEIINNRKQAARLRRGVLNTDGVKKNGK